jgi:uroporphyrinogen-III synthase
MRVLVTRPEPGASRTAERLAAAGYQPVLLPLTTIDPLPASPLPPAVFDAVAVTSANALRHASTDVLSTTRHLPCFTVGAETARIAREVGFAKVESAEGDAPALAGLIATKLPRGSRLLYLCGRLRRPTFEAALAEAGFRVIAIETYETLPAEYTSDDLRTHLGPDHIDVVLVHSAEAALSFARLLHAADTPALSPRPLFLCISPRVAAVLAGEHLETIVAMEPTEASMLSALASIRPGKP